MTSKPRILIVDDNAAIRGLLKDILSPLYNVVVADRPSFALNQISREVPDLIITDICLPEYTGIQLLEQLRKTHGKLLPVLIITANACRLSAMEAQQLGAYDYLSKPIHPDDVLEKVRAALLCPTPENGAFHVPAWKKVANQDNLAHSGKL